MRRAWPFCCLALASGFLGQSSGEAWFFRTVGDSNSIVTGLSSSFILESSHVADSGRYLIERSDGLNPAHWTPYLRGNVSNHLTTSRVHAPPPSDGTLFIPGGMFTMGDAVGDDPTSTPLHTVLLNPFFMKTNEVTNEEMRGVLQWAYERRLVAVATVPPDGPFGGRVVRTTQGATNDLLGLDEFAEEISFTNELFGVKTGKENHPCVYASWYGSVAYCHFKSLMEGKESCYDLNEWRCDFSKDGYRLPTEAEWECAARGGYEGMRFPWGDTNVITHSRANYRSTTNYVYDVSPTRGFHPTYAAQPLRTSPVGMFASNAYGLHDMCGNVWEWCWDWASPYTAVTLSNPTGPSSGVYKVFRGGSNYTTAQKTTCAARYTSTRPEAFGFDIGFRYVRTCRN